MTWQLIFQIHSTQLDMTPCHACVCICVDDDAVTFPFIPHNQVVKCDGCWVVAFHFYDNRRWQNNIRKEMINLWHNTVKSKRVNKSAFIASLVINVIYYSNSTMTNIINRSVSMESTYIRYGEALVLRCRRCFCKIIDGYQSTSIVLSLLHHIHILYAKTRFAVAFIHNSEWKWMPAHPEGKRQEENWKNKL